MPENKDFLDQFSNEGKPASFQEEERIPVQRERRPLNVKALIIALAVLLVLGIVAYFLFLAPKIEMPDFVGKNRNDIVAWVKQQGIETSGVVFEENYDFDTDEGTVLSQSLPAGKKVRKDVKLNFVLSLGPDPDERVNFPNLEGMYKEDVQSWISSNKLTKTRISTSYNDNVGENEVIDYNLSGCDEDTFTRGCTLRINISKGAAPAGTVTVEDFEKKIYETAESWAKSKKINLTKSEVYSDKVDAGLIISQSVAAGKTMKEGETLNVVVSKGKAVYMPDMVGWTESKLKAWQNKNPSVVINEEGRYSSQAKGIVLSQNIAAGKLLDVEDYVELKVSLGNIVDLDVSFVGQEYHAVAGLHDWKDKQNDKGADINVNRYYEFSDTVPADCIIRHDMSVEVGGTLNVVVSKGRNILLKDGKDVSLTWTDLAKGNADEDTARKLCEENEVVYEVVYSYQEGKNNGDVIRAYRDDGLELRAGAYLPQDVTVKIIVSDDVNR